MELSLKTFSKNFLILVKFYENKTFANISQNYINNYQFTDQYIWYILLGDIRYRACGDSAVSTTTGEPRGPSSANAEQLEARAITVRTVWWLHR